MKRRHFIKTTGASLGAALLAPALGTLCSCRSTHPGAATSDFMALPEAVSVETQDKTLSLTSTDGLEWSNASATVLLRRVGGALSVQVRAPGVPLKTVILHWRHESQPQALVLGDAWERYYGGHAWHTIVPNEVMPWYMMECDGELTHGFGVKTGCAAMCGWQMGGDHLKLIMDVRSGGLAVRLGDRTLNAAQVVTRKGRAGETSFQADQAFCKLMCERPLLPREPMVGTLDWYYTFGKCTEPLFVAEAELFARLVDGCDVKAFALVDAGWAVGDRDCWHDDQTVSHPEFGDIQAVATKVRALGLVPGIWTRVLCANPKDPEAVRSTRERKFLDPSVPENLERIRNLMRLYRSWGYRVIKHDFSAYDTLGRWGWEMPGMAVTPDGWTFRDNSRTTAEVILGLYEAIREGCGKDTTIIGCNTVSHLSAGLVEYCRIGDDSGGSLERAIKVGCNPFAFRLPQNEAFYVIDPDCIGNLAAIDWKYYRQFIRLASESGALLQLSTRLGHITPEQRSALRAGFRRIGAGKPATVEPLDWMQRSIPATWKIGDDIVQMDWNLTPLSR